MWSRWIWIPVKSVSHSLKTQKCLNVGIEAVYTQIKTKKLLVESLKF